MATYDLTTTTPSKLKTGDIINCPYSGNIKTIILPKGQYKLETWGAQGGEQAANYAGRGAYSWSIYNFEEEESLKILTGGKGNYASSAGTGGGGSFIATSSNVPLVVAGGGGGVQSGQGLYTSSNYYYTNGQSTQLGGNCPTGYTATTAGEGGYGNNSSGAAGGGGFFSNGKGNPSYGNAGISFTNGGAAVACTSNTNVYSGFGGGGSTHGGSGGGGGAGGYTGGGGGNHNSPGNGGGGGSFYNSDNGGAKAGYESFFSPSGTEEVGHSGDGYCRITVLNVGPSMKMYIKRNNQWIQYM